MKVLIAGGAGYIGSTVAWACADAGISPVILDSLVTGRREFAAGHPFYHGDIADGPLADRIFAEHPDILDAQVIGVPDARYGEELMAWVRLRAGAPELTAESLREFCRGQLAHYKVPRYVHVVDEFPMTVTGKVRKVEMRERAVEILGLP